jgi:serine O-acetyltransferase
MKLVLTSHELVVQLLKQLDSLFIINKDATQGYLLEACDNALRYTETNFSSNNNKYYKDGGETIFNPYHSDQYAVFIYFMSRALLNIGNAPKSLLEQLYCLNKALHSIDLFYEVELPSKFTLSHPLGTVLGRAYYNDYFFVSQHCTVGGNRGGYVRFGENVRMMADSKVIGKSSIGNHVIIAADAYVKDDVVPDYSLVFGSSPNLIIKQKEPAYFLVNDNYDLRKM